MDAARYSAEERLKIIRHVENGQAVSRVCEEFQISRTIFYRWKHRYAVAGLDGLVDRPPIHKDETTKTPEAVIKAIVAAARQHPQLGCRDIATLVSETCQSVSYTKVQAALNEARLGTKRDRWLALEEEIHRKGSYWISPEQFDFIARWNPNHHDRSLQCAEPAENLTAAIFRLPRSTELTGRVFVAVIDAYSSFAYMNAVARPRDAHVVIVEALTLFAQMGRLAQGASIFTDDSPLLGYRNRQLVDALGKFRIRHFAAHSQNRGFVERFRLWLIDRLREEPAGISSFKSLLEDYNFREQLLGFPNYGQTPAARFHCVNKERKQNRLQS